MKDDVNIHIQFDSSYALRLTIECPSCHVRQDVPIVDVHTGTGFVCKCGDEFPISAAAFSPVQHELDELRHLISKTITLIL